jgi:hypothetical protein
MEVENRFNEYCEYVPLRKEHYGVWSLKLASIIIETCSILDSFFKAGSFWLFDYPGFENKEFSKEIKKVETDKTNICTWKRIFNSFYDFSAKEIHVIPLKESICPFNGWNENCPLEWWDTYNEVKHDRFRKLEKADFEIALHALAGLFLAIVLHVPNKMYLYNTGIIKYKGTLAETSYHCADMFLRKEPVIMKGNDQIIANTSLFSYKYQEKILNRVLSKASRKGGIVTWPSDRLWPECKKECHYVECYRDQMSEQNL